MMRAWGLAGLAFCAGVMVAVVAVSAVGNRGGYASRQLVVEATPGCFCVFLPEIVNEAVSMPTMPYTRSTLAIVPAQQEIQLGELATVAAWLGPVTDVQAIEARIFYNPVMLDFQSSAPGDFNLNCDEAAIFSVQPGAIRLDCEMSEPVSGAGSLVALTFRGITTGTATVETWGQAAFVGNSNGWGYNPEIVTGTVVVR